MEPLVQVSDLKWTYVGSKRPALNGINFSLMPGVCWALQDRPVQEKRRLP